MITRIIESESWIMWIKQTKQIGWNLSLCIMRITDIRIGEILKSVKSAIQIIETERILDELNEMLAA